MKLSRCFRAAVAVALVGLAGCKSTPEPALNAESLREMRVETLGYEVDQFPANVVALIEGEANTEAIAAEYRRDEGDRLYRFNVILVLVNKIPMASDADRAIIAATLLSATEDDHFWVRTEAAYGLGELRDVRYASALRSLLQDDEEQVRTVALRALGKLPL